jgi:hypothetical protein
LIFSEQTIRAMPDADKRAWLQHNEHGAKVCGWSARR